MRTSLTQVLKQIKHMDALGRQILTAIDDENTPFVSIEAMLEKRQDGFSSLTETLNQGTLSDVQLDTEYQSAMHELVKQNEKISGHIRSRQDKMKIAMQQMIGAGRFVANDTSKIRQGRVFDVQL